MSRRAQSGRVSSARQRAGARPRSPSSRRGARHPRFLALDGSHPYKAVAGAYVDYPARRRRDGRVAYFNFALAREMGLIEAGHPDRLTRALERAILDTFCLVIVNEYDQLHGLEVPERDRLPGTYMATRYLQLQHPGRLGTTSGDGRSIWNGRLRSRGTTWDVSSQGTGVTRLCPATAIEGRFFETGNDGASYGCGTAALDEGLGTALMSEVLHRNGVGTERVLAVIELPDGLSINVRAAPNLIRPSHFFAPLRQGRYDALRAIADLFLDRQEANGACPRRRGAARYRGLASDFARTFARFAARLERDYIFVWMDWDGDNVLASGGIVDYGSVRQFGLFHREYRFDDVDRLSTTIPEQRRKARDMARKFAQIRDYLVEGRKRPLASYARDPVLEVFDREFDRAKRELGLRQLGLPENAVAALLRRPPASLPHFERALRHFEHARSARGPLKVPDGLTWNAIFCVRDWLRELPARFRDDPRPLDLAEFLEVGLSSYASRRDRSPSSHRRRMASLFQRTYLELMETAARRTGRSRARLLAEVADRSAVINRADRITGNGVDYATGQLLRARRRLTPEQVYALVDLFAQDQELAPPASRSRRRATPRRTPPSMRRLLEAMCREIEDHREGL
ncbi:MAG: hypothetical protein ACQGVK_25155 [Myxococcota bacterium]